MVHLRAGLGRAPLRRSLDLLVVVAAVFACSDAYLAAEQFPGHRLTVISYPIVGLAFVVVGAVATSRRPSNPTGSLLTLTGALILTSALDSVGVRGLERIGQITGQLPIAAFLHLVMAFPAGRLVHRFDVGLVATGYGLAIVLQLPVAFDSVPAFGAPSDVAQYLVVVLTVVAAARLTVRIARTERIAERRVMLAVASYGIGMLLFFPISAHILSPWLGLDPFARFSLQLAVFVVAPFVFAAGILRGGFGRAGEIGELTAWLNSDAAGRSTLRDILARLLGDPSLQVLFPGADPGTYIDADGRSVTPVESPSRARDEVLAGDGDVTAILVYDRTLLSDPAAVRQAGQVAALALQREGLQAELLAEREALRASRTRVMEVGDQQRRRLAQDLHDVLQSRLTLAAMHAGSLASDSDDEVTRAGVEKLRLELDALITEFRSMVHGVMPALLVERGLAAAVEDLVDRQPVPAHLHLVGGRALSPLLSTTAYFILAEALTNAVRHARARRLDIVVDERDRDLLLEVRDDGIGGAVPSGAGLRGIADRVEALSGQLVVDSPAGSGTRIAVVLPYGS